MTLSESFSTQINYTNKEEELNMIRFFVGDNSPENQISESEVGDHLVQLLSNSNRFADYIEKLLYKPTVDKQQQRL